MTGNIRRFGELVLIAGAGLGLIVAVFNYFWTQNGIHGTAGALLVIISSLLILLASVAVTPASAKRRWWSVVLNVLIALGILGTGVAAWLLEAPLLLTLMAVAMIGWLMSLMNGADRHSREPGTYSGATR